MTISREVNPKGYSILLMSWTLLLLPILMLPSPPAIRAKRQPMGRLSRHRSMQDASHIIYLCALRTSQFCASEDLFCGMQGSSPIILESSL